MIPRSGGLPAPHPYAISPDGGTIVGQFAPGNPFVFRSGNITRFRPSTTVDDVYTQAVSQGGKVIVGRAGRAYAFSAGKLTLFPKLEGVEDSFAYGVSDNGLVVTGYAEGAEETQAFLWTPGQKPSFLPPVDLYERLMPTGIDGKGQTVCGIASDGVETMPFVGTLKKTTLLKLPKGMKEGAAHGIDATGTITVGLAHNSKQTRAVVWLGSNPTLLPNPQKTLVSEAVLAKSISRDGSLIGGSVGERAMAWVKTPKGFEGRLLSEWLKAKGVSVSGWSLESVTSVAATSSEWFLTGFGHFGGREAGYLARIKR